MEDLPPKVALAIALEEKARRVATRKLFTFFPDTGPLRRELYKKHMLFFKLGADKSIRGFMAGNRCVTGNQRIDHPDGSSTRADKLYQRGEPFEVTAWNGMEGVAAKAVTPIKKDAEPCYLMMLSSGDTLKVAGRHFILTKSGGYVSCEELLQSVPYLGVSIVEYARSVLRAGGLRCRRIIQGFLGGCRMGLHSGDAQPQSVLGSDQGFSPLLGDARPPNVVSLPTDGLEHIRTNSDRQSACRLSSLGVLRQIAARCVVSSGLALCTIAQWLSLTRRAILRYQIGSSVQSVLVAAGVAPIQDDSECGDSSSYACSRSGLSYQPKRLAAWLFRCAASFVQQEREQYQSPLLESPEIGGNRIIAYIAIGNHDLYDFTVPKYHNYLTAGVFSHNTGKTEGGGGYETTLHLTGRYPEWWEGAEFDAPVRWWVAGDTSKTVREILQYKLLGSWGKFGTGLIPGDDIVRWTPKQGVPEAVDTLWIKHYDKHGIYDGDSRVEFKSYDQKREAFQGTEQDGIWLDEEADDNIRGECILRLMTTNGLLIETFTPLRGITPVVMQYLPNGEATDEVAVTEDKALVMAGWDDVPHLGEAEKKRMLAETPPYLRDARSKGIPSLGSGAIYPVPESEIKVNDFPIPVHWPRLYALDVGWNRTAALWGAWDKENDVIYLTAEYYRSQAEPVIHAAAIKAKGEWIPGEIDPAARGRGQRDGERLFKDYEDLGLNIAPANNTVESGLYDVWGRLSTGRLKVFASLNYWFSEYRLYRRDEKGRIVKENDHLMDDTRYLVNAAPDRWTTKSPKNAPLMKSYGVLDQQVGF